MSKRYPGGIIRRTPQTPSQTSAQGIWDMASVTQAVRENNWPIAGVPDPLSRSLRFRSSASAWLSRTPASVGNRRTWTWSAWVKRGAVDTEYKTLLCVGSVDGAEDVFAFTGNQLYLRFSTGSDFISTQVFRDPSAWYHIMLVADTTQSVEADRLNYYVNGVKVTNFSSSTRPTQNFEFRINTTQQHAIGRFLRYSPGYFDGYMTEVYLIDGQALTPSSFGTTDSQTGVWEPVVYTGTYGTNGFYLPFSNVASTATLGYDFSGNNNNWTTNNISLTSGSTYDSMVDVPTLWIPYNTAGDTGALWRGNYCVWNPLSNGAGTLSNANLQLGGIGGAGLGRCNGTIAVSSGKWYFESTLTTASSYTNIGIGQGDITNQYPGQDSVSYAFTCEQAIKINNNSQPSYGVSLTTGDVLMVAFDLDNNKIFFGKNGTWMASSDPVTGANPAFTIAAGTYKPIARPYDSSGVINVNFGQRPFAYTPPSGFRTLNTTNLPTPTIGATATTTANKYFDATLYTGNGSTQSITNSGSMQPDFLWIKRRDAAASHAWIDSVRGISNQLASNNTNAEATGCTDGITSLNSNGFSLGAGAIGYITNTNGASLVAWQWRASNATAVTNTSGSITSTVSANTTAGFSIVTYTGTGSNATVGHGLGVAPSMVIVKERNNANVWGVGHSGLTSWAYHVRLNSTDAQSNADPFWNNTAPTSSVFSIGGAVTAVNRNGGTYVAYCFAQVAGYSAFGSYTGNGSTDGPFVFCGFRPRFIMIKRTDSADDWEIRDTSLNPYNTTQNTLFANLSQAEATLTDRNYDILSNGFKLRGTDAENNGSGGTYIYMAFAESPFKFALAR